MPCLIVVSRSNAQVIVDQTKCPFKDKFDFFKSKLGKFIGRKGCPFANQSHFLPFDLCGRVGASVWPELSFTWALLVGYHILVSAQQF